MNVAAFGAKTHKFSRARFSKRREALPISATDAAQAFCCVGLRMDAPSLRQTSCGVDVLATVNLHLAENILQVGFHRLVADVELCGDLFVGRATA